MDRPPRLAKREVRLLRRTERALRQDPRLAAQFDVFAATSASGRHAWIWITAGLGMFVGTALLMIETVAGLVIFVLVWWLMLWHFFKAQKRLSENGSWRVQRRR